MKLILITGNHPRHFYLAKKLYKKFDNIFWIIEKREKFIPKTNIKNLKLKKLYKKHFIKRNKIENKFFGDSKKTKSLKFYKKNYIDRKKFQISIKSLLKNEKADLLLSFGCSKIDNSILKKKNIKKYLNIHGGLSPDFRGSISNFWPTYLLEPQLTGYTLHKLSNSIDGGEIIFQTSVKLNKNDGIHDSNCRALKTFINYFVKKINIKSLRKIKGIKQKNFGKIWQKKDWDPKHLDLIYNKYNDKIINYCLKNKFKLKRPKLINVLKNN